MKKFIKSYYPMMITILFLSVYGFMLGGVFSGFLDNVTNKFLIVGVVVLTILLVIGIWAEIIGFIIHAAKNKRIKNPVGWCFLIYFFNVFIIPYYNLKYVVNKKKTVIPMVIFGILIFFSTFAGCLSSILPSILKPDEVLYVTSEDGEVQFKLSGSYVEKEVGEYELYASDNIKDITVGAFVYDDEDDVSSDYIHEYRESWIMDASTNVKLVDSYKEELDDRIIVSKIYKGEEGLKSVIYQFSTIEFKNSEYIVDVLQSVPSKDYFNRDEELKTMLNDVELLID